MILRIFLLTLSLSILFACQSNETTKAKEAAAAEVFETATKPIYARFYLRYLDRDKRLKSTANFYQQTNGQQKGMKLEGDVRIEGRNMSFKNLRDIELRYDNLYDVPAKENYTFEFNTFGGKSQSYQANMPLIKSFSVTAGVKKSTGFTLEINATDLEESEVLLLMFTDGDSHTETLNIFGPMAVANLAISAEAVKNLTLGRNELRLIRKRTERIKEKNYSGESNTEYYSEPIFVEVTE